MKIKKYIAGAVLFLTIIACVVPGASQPASPIDPSWIPTIIVLTANAAITQTAAAAPTPVVTQTTTPDPSAVNGTIELLPNGSTKYTDAQAGFEITYPAGWLTLRPNSDEFNSALANEAAKNDVLHDQMESDQAEYDPDFDRLCSYPLRPDIEKNFLFGFSKLKWDPDDSASLDEYSMGELVRSLEASGLVPGYRSDMAQMYENINHINLVEIGGQFTIRNSDGYVVPFYITAIFFKPDNGSTIRVTFTYLKDYKPEIYNDVTAVIASIKLLGQ